MMRASPGRAAAEAAAFFEERGAGRTMDGAVHPAPAEQRLVRGVDDRVHLEPRDVALCDFDPVRHVQVPAGGIGGDAGFETADPCQCENLSSAIVTSFFNGLEATSAIRTPFATGTRPTEGNP